MSIFLKRIRIEDATIAPKCPIPHNANKRKFSFRSFFIYFSALNPGSAGELPRNGLVFATARLKNSHSHVSTSRPSIMALRHWMMCADGLPLLRLYTLRPQYVRKKPIYVRSGSQGWCPAPFRTKLSALSSKKNGACRLIKDGMLVWARGFSFSHGVALSSIVP